MKRKTRYEYFAKKLKPDFVRVTNSLPPPKDLFGTDVTKKITVALDETTIKLFKKFAKKEKKSYQQMMRVVLKVYARNFF